MIGFRKGLGVSRLMSEKCCILDLSPLPVIFFGRDEPVLVNEKAHGLGCTILPDIWMCMMRLYLRVLHTAVPIWVIVRFPEIKIHTSALDLCINTAIEAILDITAGNASRCGSPPALDRIRDPPLFTLFCPPISVLVFAFASAFHSTRTSYFGFQHILSFILGEYCSEDGNA